MVHEVEGKLYVISSHGCWRPGCYDKKQTARYAFQFKDEDLVRLQDEANKRNGGIGGVITKADLQSI